MIFRRICICKSTHRWVLGCENKKDQEAAGEIKHAWETRNGQAVIARGVSLLSDWASPCIIYVDICSYISAHRGVPVMEC